jgi:UrcA family protein
MQRFLIVAAAAAALIATPALAADREPVKMHVNLKGLDLTSEKGAQTALNRIDSAARTTCTIDNSGRRVRAIDQTCVGEMTARAVASLNAPQVLALLEAKKAG